MKDVDEDTRSVIAGLEVSEIFEGEGDHAEAIGSVKKVKLASRLGALDMLMRYHALYKDKVELSGQVILADQMAMARVRVFQVQI